MKVKVHINEMVLPPQFDRLGIGAELERALAYCLGDGRGMRGKTVETGEWSAEGPGGQIADAVLRKL